MDRYSDDYPRRLNIKFQLERPSGFKEDLYFDISMTLGQGQEMTLIDRYVFAMTPLGVLARQIKSIFNKNRAFSETSMKFGM